MKIYEVAVRKPISTILIFVGVIVMGLFSLRNLAIDLYPEMDLPTISVFTSYAGASAADIETNITKVLEDNLNTVNKLKKLTSKSYDNFSLVSLEFEWGANLDEASNDIRDAVSRVEPLLPEDAEKPMIFKFSSSMIPVLYLSATASESYNALYKILEEKVTNPINRVEGVGAVSISGAPVREIQVNLDPVKMEAYNLSIEQIGPIIAQENLNVPAGTLDIGSESFSLRVEGEFNASELLNKVVVSNINGRRVHLSDVATVKDTIRKQTLDERINSERGVRIVIQKQSGANSVQVSDNIVAMLPALQKTLPPDIKLNIIYNTSDFIKDSIGSLTETVMYAFIFVSLVVLFFLGRWRATFIIILTIPVSLVASFIYLYATGGSLNIISLSSLSIAIGMVVDDAIVVLENITKHMERGSSAREASIYGTNEVWLAVIATTLTVIAVFFPLTMVSGIAGIMFKQLGWIVTIVIIISMLAAITLTPMLSAQMLKTQNNDNKLVKMLERFLDKLDSGYASILTWSVRHRTFLIICCVLIFVSSLMLISRVPSEFFPSTDNGQISAVVELKQGTGLETTSQLARVIEKKVKQQYPEVQVLSTSAGAADGSNIFAAFGKSGTHVINFTMRLSKTAERDRDIFLISDLFRKNLDSIPEIVTYSVTPGGSGGGMGGPSTVDIEIFGYDFDVTGAYAAQIAEKMKLVKGTRDVKISREEMKQEYRVNFDRDKLAFYGINIATAANFVRNRINGLTASKYRESGNEYDIVVRYDEKFRTTIADIENILIYNPQGKTIRVKDVGRVEERYSPPTIERENRQRVIKISSTMFGAALGEIVVEARKIIDTSEIPAGVTVNIGGTAEDQQESFADLGTLLLLIIVLVYIVMATQFESMLMPFIIMLSLPFAFTGVFLILFLTNTPLSLIALIGAIMLVGIVVKNGIVMVDFTNLLRERGLSINQSVIAAGKSRLRPVLMTTLATILGMLPLAIGSGEGSAMWKPMGIAIIGGLTFSTVLTLIVIPIVYTLFGARGMKRERKRIQKISTQLQE